MPLLDESVRDLLAAISSPAPAPGGGSASALASALGVSLLMMVGALPKTRTGTDEDKTALSSAARTLAGIGAELAAAIDRDASAYEQVVAAYRLPKASAGELQARKAAIQEALRAATDEPLAVMRFSAVALQEAKTVAAHGHKAAASDVAVAVILLEAGLHGAHLNVDTNLGSIHDDVYARTVRSDAEDLVRRAEEAAAEARRSLKE